jgi:hypothetical protein
LAHGTGMGHFSCYVVTRKGPTTGAVYEEGKTDSVMQKLGEPTLLLLYRIQCLKIAVTI